MYVFILYLQISVDTSSSNIQQAQVIHHTSDLNMGSITEVWKSTHEWKKFYTWLDHSPPEGLDSSNVPMKLSRYAKFLSLFVQLHCKEKELIEQGSKNANQILMDRIEAIHQDPEGFFDTERCLRCIDAGVRKQVMDNLKQVRKSQADPGVWVYQPAYSPVLDKLNHLLGFYHEK